MSINFLGDNSTTIALGAKVKDIKFKYTNGKEATIAEGEKANLEGEAYEAYVTYNNGVVKAFTVSAGFVFPKNALATVECKPPSVKTWEQGSMFLMLENTNNIHSLDCADYHFRDQREGCWR